MVKKTSTFLEEFIVSQRTDDKLIYYKSCSRKIEQIMVYSQVEVSFSSTLQYSSEDQMYRQLKRCFHSGDCNREKNGGKGKKKKKGREGVLGF